MKKFYTLSYFEGFPGDDIKETGERISIVEADSAVEALRTFLDFVDSEVYEIDIYKDYIMLCRHGDDMVILKHEFRFDIYEYNSYGELGEIDDLIGATSELEVEGYLFNKYARDETHDSAISVEFVWSDDLSNVTMVVDGHDTYYAYSEEAANGYVEE